MTTNGTGQTYQWDAENRLVKITYADSSSTTFQYDGLSRRTRITERNAANTITSDKRYLWSDSHQPSEERNATTNAVTKRYFEEGEQRIGGTDAGNYYYTKDHLGSIRELTTTSGTIAARYDYDLWGKRVKLSGTFDTEVGFTSHHHHAKSDLVLTWYRVYDAESGTWLSADPLGEAGGLNLYAYVGGNPLNLTDRLGLCPLANPMNAQAWTDPSKGFAPTPDQTQAALDAAGMVPVFGEFFDAINGVISGFRGNWGDTGLSLTAMIPIVGNGATAAKIARKQVFKHFPTLKAAKDAAASCPTGPWQKNGKTKGPEKHKVGDPHYHDGNHDNLSKPNVHYGFPDSQF